MKNKVLIELVVPEIEEKYDVLIPINKRIGNIILLLTKAINEINNELLIDNPEEVTMYNKTTSDKYLPNDLVRQTDIRNGTTIILIQS